MRTTIQAVALSVIAMVGTLTPGDALALHRQTPFLEPIPFPAIDGVQSFRPFCQGEAARWIAFDSTSDLLHNGSGGGEVFVWDNDPAGPRHLVQVTNCATGSSQDASTVADGKVVVFDTTSDLNKPRAQQCIAPLAHRQIMRATIKQGQIGYEQLTNDLNGDCTSPRVSADGFKIVFECTGDMRRNGSSGTHIFLWRDYEERLRSAVDPALQQRAADHAEGRRHQRQRRAEPPGRQDRLQLEPGHRRPFERLPAESGSTTSPRGRRSRRRSA